MYPNYPPVNMNVPGYTMPNRPQPRCTQPVTQEMSKMIFMQEDDLSVKITPIEKIKNQCTHKYPGTGQIALVEGTDGKCTCRVCGESFHLIDNPNAEIATTTERMRDILQSIKTMYLDIPENFAKEYFQLITLLDRAPALFEKACKNFNMYDQYSGNPMQIYPGFNSFQQVNAVLGMNIGGMAPQQPMMYQQPMAGGYQPVAQQPNPAQAPGNVMPMYQQPMAPGYQPQMMYQQPMTTPGFDPNANPLMYGGAPAPTGPAVTPTAPAPAADPSEVTQTKAFSI